MLNETFSVIFKSLWEGSQTFRTKVQRKGHISSSIRQRSVGYNVTYNFFVSVEPKGFSVHEKISISAKSIWYSVSLRRDWICCLTRHENSKGSSILHTPPQLFFKCHTLTIRVENDCKVILKKLRMSSTKLHHYISLLILAFEKAEYLDKNFMVIFYSRDILTLRKRGHCSVLLEIFDAISEDPLINNDCLMSFGF